MDGKDNNRKKFGFHSPNSGDLVDVNLDPFAELRGKEVRVDYVGSGEFADGIYDGIIDRGAYVRLCPAIIVKGNEPVVSQNPSYVPALQSMRIRSLDQSLDDCIKQYREQTRRRQKGKTARRKKK